MIKKLLALLAAPIIYLVGFIVIIPFYFWWREYDVVRQEGGRMEG